MNITVEDLLRFCSVDPFRDSIATPFIEEIEGVEWSIATDGRWLIAARGKLRGVEKRKGVPRCHEIISPGLMSTVTEMIDVARMREWAGEPNWPTQDKCEYCDGSGICDCARCEKEGNECAACEGEGSIRANDHGLNGGIHGKIVDCNRIACLLTLSDAPTIEFCAGLLDTSAPVYLRGSNWIAVLMPIYQSDGKPTPAKEWGTP